MTQLIASLITDYNDGVITASELLRLTQPYIQARSRRNLALPDQLTEALRHAFNSIH